jgi:uncharacterized membrane protein YgaE (UPF0421/DUF939 family)
MFTSIDKAIVAAIMSLLYIWNALVPTHFIGLTPEMISVVIGGLTPLLVWLIPNKPDYSSYY